MSFEPPNPEIRRGLPILMPQLLSGLEEAGFTFSESDVPDLQTLRYIEGRYLTQMKVNKKNGQIHSMSQYVLGDKFSTSMLVELQPRGTQVFNVVVEEGEAPGSISQLDPSITGADLYVKKVGPKIREVFFSFSVEGESLQGGYTFDGRVTSKYNPEERPKITAVHNNLRAKFAWDENKVLGFRVLSQNNGAQATFYLKPSVLEFKNGRKLIDHVKRAKPLFICGVEITPRLP